MGLVIIIMGQNCEETIGMCLESVKDADVIIYCDGGSTDETLQTIKDFKYCIHEDSYKHVTVIENKYDQDNPNMNGIQRNFYLNYLKENYQDDWALCLDSDDSPILVHTFSKYLVIFFLPFF